MPAGTEWCHIWNKQSGLQRLVTDLEATKGAGNNAAGINDGLIQIVQNWANDDGPPQWVRFWSLPGDLAVYSTKTGPFIIN